MNGKISSFKKLTQCFQLIVEFTHLPGGYLPTQITHVIIVQVDCKNHHNHDSAEKQYEFR